MAFEFRLPDIGEGVVEGEVVKLGIAAPSEVPVHRKEVYEEIQRSNQQALTKQSTPLPKLAGRLPSLKPAAAL